MLAGVDCVATTCYPAGVFVLARCAIRAKWHFSCGLTKHGLPTTVIAGQGVRGFVVAGVDTFIFVITGRAAATAIAYRTDSFVHIITIDYKLPYDPRRAHDPQGDRSAVPHPTGLGQKDNPLGPQE